jgi:hypothetical protein
MKGNHIIMHDEKVNELEKWVINITNRKMKKALVWENSVVMQRLVS